MSTIVNKTLFVPTKIFYLLFSSKILGLLSSIFCYFAIANSFLYQAELCVILYKFSLILGI